MISCEVGNERPQPDRGIFAATVWHPHAREREPRPEAEVCLRTFDPVLGCWVKVLPVNPKPQPPPPAPRPVGDGSGARWAVIDRTTGERLWTIEAECFELALLEKRRLCRGVGGKSGWAYLAELPME